MLSIIRTPYWRQLMVKLTVTVCGSPTDGVIVTVAV